MKRTSSLTTSTLKITSAIALTAIFGGTAFAGPDNPKIEAEEAKTKIERIVVEDDAATLDSSVMPNADPDAATSAEDAENIVATWSDEATEEIIIDLPEAEIDALKMEAGDIVVESPEAVIISNPDEVLEGETDADADEALTPED